MDLPQYLKIHKHHNVHTDLQMDLGGKDRVKARNGNWLYNINMTQAVCQGLSATGDHGTREEYN